ncbi:MAG: acyl-CoA mutase large subunit family protein, partial [Gemmatimonadota bacterium]|nr:acyl-CoA mutase large subunit family protein [Gemmatimonadota bacterium]
YVESLTDELEQRATALMQRVEDLGGSAAAIEKGFFQDEIARSAYEFQQRVEGGETVIVGVNRFTDDSEELSIPSPDYAGMERGQVARLAKARTARDAGKQAATLSALGAAAKSVKNGKATAALMPLVIDAVRARASVGEISDALAGAWGRYVPA